MQKSNEFVNRQDVHTTKAKRKKHDAAFKRSFKKPTNVTIAQQRGTSALVKDCSAIQGGQKTQSQSCTQPNVLILVEGMKDC